MNVNGGNHIEGNFLGTDPGGTTAQGNEGHAILLGTSGDNVIGGATPGARNVISASGQRRILRREQRQRHPGQLHRHAARRPQSPRQPAGPITVGINGAHNNTIGGTAAGEGNVIAFNQIYGFAGEASAGNGNAIRGNSIHDNGALGIDLLGAVGPTANDPGDADTGANNLQNFPIVRSVEHLVRRERARASSAGSTARHRRPTTSTSIRTPCAATSRAISSRARSTSAPPQVTTDGSGNAAIDVTCPSRSEPANASPSTATDPVGNTSEFSQRIVF